MTGAARSSRGSTWATGVEAGAGAGSGAVYAGWGAGDGAEISNKEGSAFALEPDLDTLGARGFTTFGFLTAAELGTARVVRLTAFLGLPAPAAAELVISDSSMS